MAMQYQESAASSAELLRLVLQRIGKHGGAYTPTTYAVWYEYLAGVNPKLTAALDARLQSAEPLTQAEIDRLHAQYIHAREVGSLETFQTGISELLRRLGEVAASSGAGAAEYGKSLVACQQELGSISDPAALSRVIQSLVKSTDAVRLSNESLQQEVLATRDEVQQLRGQMGALQNQALTDPLTRLRNRRGFEQAVAEITDGRAEHLGGCAVLMADIDHFKRVNDKYGHLIGDQVIRAAAQVLQHNVKGRDVAARWGGEEFIVLLPQTHGQGAAVVAENLRVAFSKTRIKRGGKQELSEPVTISIGVAEAMAGESLEQAVGRADAALYAAKNAGRNCVRVADPAAGAVRADSIPVLQDAAAL
jgi:diguanylate cyclase